MRIRAFSLFLFLSLFGKLAFSQSHRINDRTKIYTKNFVGDSVVLKADNDFTIPVTVKVDLTLENLKSGGRSVSVVVPAKVTGKTIAVFYPENPDKTYKCTYSWKIAVGDTSKTPDKDFAYSYPYLNGTSFKITQGPNGNFSHKNMFAFDFGMPQGTPVCAVRDGVIAMTKGDSDKGGPDKKYIDDANFISIYHMDGTLASYYHLKKGGITVKEGQHVKKGQIIGYSGNTGYSDGAHLHFEITQPRISSDQKKWLAFSWEIPGGNTLSMNTTSNGVR
jgi:murein DD-endopeptidase MepM/ murein hydrolase activator NlpD